MAAPPSSGSAHVVLDSDQALVSRVVTIDDRHAFRILVERHQGAIRSVLRRLTRGDNALADDLAQTSMLRAYITLNTFQGKSELRTWLYRVACNEFFQYRRGQQGKENVGVDVAHRSDLDETSADISTHAAMSIDLERAMLQLTPGEREAIVLTYYAELTHQEVAHMLDCPLGTVKSNISRGKLKLYQALLAWAPKNSQAVQ